MGRLGDAAPGRVYVDCASCNRSGRYTVASLIGRYGADISTIDLLRHLTASCRHQRPPGAQPARKYEHLCLAAITLPPPTKKVPPVPPGVPYTIEVWRDRVGGMSGGLDSALGDYVGNSPLGLLGPTVVLQGLLGGASSRSPQESPASLPLVKPIPTTEPLSHTIFSCPQS